LLIYYSFLRAISRHPLQVLGFLARFLVGFALLSHALPTKNVPKIPVGFLSCPEIGLHQNLKKWIKKVK
jgi:hypothetical protein